MRISRHLNGFDKTQASYTRRWWRRHSIVAKIYCARKLFGNECINYSGRSEEEPSCLHHVRVIIIRVYII